MERSKEMNTDRRAKLNLFLLRQSYLVRKLQYSKSSTWNEILSELVAVQSQIQTWYRKAAEKIKHQSRVDEFQVAEQTRIYHHELHKKHLKKSSIVKLETEKGLLVGHDDCAEYLEDLVAELLSNPAQLDKISQEILLAEVETVITEEDNIMLSKIPDKKDVLDTLNDSNLNAAPGTDGITSLLYKVCWDSLGDSLTAVSQEIFKNQDEKLPVTMRTSMMVFGSKPKKPNSLKARDKRRLSLLNCDFKLVEGLEAKKFKKLSTRCLSPLQYVAGKDRKIHHGIAKARDAIYASSQAKSGCAIADMDFIAAFDWLVLSWVWQVLIKMGVDKSVVRRVQRLYEHSVTIVVVNNKLGRVFLDVRGSLRQGGCASMEWFAIGIDPLLRYLEKRLKGILITSIPVSGPVPHGQNSPLPPLEERFKLMAYCDDVKPSITSMAEFSVVDRACSLFENSSGCRLHRDPTLGKCKILTLGRWKGSLQQEDIPLNYMALSDSLEMVGVELKSTWTQTRKANGEIIQSRVSNTINSWKSGKFMDLTSRPWSINSFALSKVWFRCHTVDLRVVDHTSVTSKVKSWLYQDQLLKPEEMVLHRPISMGGLQLHNVQLKAQASLIRTFMETAAHPNFQHSLLHTLLYRIHVLGDDSIQNPPKSPPYLSPSFFSTIRSIKETTTLNITTMTVSQWYRVLIEDTITMVQPDDGPRHFKPCKAELSSPTTEWSISWRQARLKGLGSEASTFLWKVLHQLLPTEQRLARLNLKTSPLCKFCPDQCTADQAHCLFTCVCTQEIGSWLLNIFKVYDPSVSPASLLRLEFVAEEAMEMPLVWLAAQTLLHMWSVRSGGKTVKKYETRATLENKISLLRETRLNNEYELLKNIFDQNL